MQSFQPDSRSSNTKLRWEPISPRPTFSGRSPPATPFPPLACGQIWKGRDHDGVNEYEILITRLTSLHVEYAIALPYSDQIVTRRCRRDTFLLIYTYLPPESWTPYTPPQSSFSFKTLWQKLRGFFTKRGNT